LEGVQAGAKIRPVLPPKQSDPRTRDAPRGPRQPRRSASTGWNAVGDFLRVQRQLSNLSLRRLAQMANISNPYLSQIERGMFRPSAEVLKSLAAALEISAETLYSRAGLMDDVVDGACTVEEAIRLDTDLTTQQKEALIGVYRGFLPRRSD